MDLIGAYLRGLEDQESEDHETPWGGSSYADDNINSYLETLTSNASQDRLGRTNDDSRMLINQRAPYDTLDSSLGYDQNEDSLNQTEDSLMSRRSSTTRIPVLRCRSPGMSFPGSTSNSVNTSRNSSRSPERNRRKLPATPGYKSSLSSSATTSGPVTPCNGTPRESRDFDKERDLEMAASKLTNGMLGTYLHTLVNLK